LLSAFAFFFWVAFRCALRKVRLELPRYDAVAAAPDNHRVVFENEKVRVLEVTIKPGEKEPFHEHPLFSVMNIIRGAPLRIAQATLQGGNIVTGKTIEAGKDNFQPPPLWMPPQGLHSAENIGTVVFLAYRSNSKRGEDPTTQSRLTSEHLSEPRLEKPEDR
jgi:hypothetical protein